MKGVDGLLWATVISGLATGWLAILYALTNWGDDSGALSLIAAALAFGLLGRALFATLRS